MSTIRIVWGGATGPTAMAAYDAALAEANVHDYNLVTVSSVVPAGPSVEVVGEAPDLGPAGERLTVVQSRSTVGPDEAGPAVAGLAWARSESGRGLFYEATGDDAGEVQNAIREGLDHGKGLRDWEFVDDGEVVRETAGSTDSHACQVVCAVYGGSNPIC